MVTEVILFLCWGWWGGGASSEWQCAFWTLVLAFFFEWKEELSK